MGLFAAGLFILAPFAVLAAPSGTERTVDHPSRVLSALQGVVTPRPCETMEPPPTEAETEARFDLFVQAFINEADLSEAFKYIANDYIVSFPVSYTCYLGGAKGQPQTATPGWLGNGVHGLADCQRRTTTPWPKTASKRL